MNKNTAAAVFVLSPFNSTWAPFLTFLIVCVCCFFHHITQLLQLWQQRIHDGSLLLYWCSTGVRSGDCRVHLKRVNSLQYSRSQFEMTGAL